MFLGVWCIPVLFSLANLDHFALFVNDSWLLHLIPFYLCFQLEKGESLFTFARDMTLKSTKAMVQPSIPKDLDPWRSKLLWASRVLPMPLVGLLIIGSVCADVGSQPPEYPELEALSMLDFGAAMKVFLAKRLTSEWVLISYFGLYVVVYLLCGVITNVSCYMTYQSLVCWC